MKFIYFLTSVLFLASAQQNQLLGSKKCLNQDTKKVDISNALVQAANNEDTKTLQSLSGWVSQDAIQQALLNAPRNKEILLLIINNESVLKRSKELKLTSFYLEIVRHLAVTYEHNQLIKIIDSMIEKAQEEEEADSEHEEVGNDSEEDEN